MNEPLRYHVHVVQAAGDCGPWDSRLPAESGNGTSTRTRPGRSSPKNTIFRMCEGSSWPSRPVQVHACIRVNYPTVLHAVADPQTGRVPTKTAKPEKMGRHFPFMGKSRGILNRQEKLEKITQNTGKVGKFQTNVSYF